jgi:small glutamine-rich tetratricopeptide repeat-containing protein alpha
VTSQPTTENQPPAPAPTENPPAYSATSSTPSDADKKEAEALKAQGNKFVAERKYESAIKLYTEAIAKDGTNVVYYSNRFVVVLSRVLFFSFLLIPKIFLSAAAYSQLNKNDEAIADSKKASEIDPTFAKAYGRLG